MSFVNLHATFCSEKELARICFVTGAIFSWVNASIRGIVVCQTFNP